MGVPSDVQFRAKWEIALEQLDAALSAGVRRHVVLADAGYGDISDFRSGVAARGLQYVVGVKGDQIVWPPESNPQVAAGRVIYVGSFSKTLAVEGLTRYALSSRRQGLALGYGAAPPSQLAQALSILGELVRDAVR